VSSMSDRDRKILLVALPLLLVVAYWFLLLGPKRDEATKAEADLTEQQARLQTAEAAADTAKGAQGSFESDFTELVRLGKAIPSSVDMPSLIVQLDRAADGTGIHFTRISTGERETVAAPAATTGGTTGSTTGTGDTPVAAGGETAQSGSGQAVESANNAAAATDQSTAAAEQSGVDATTSTSSSTGSLPVGGGSTAAATGTTTGTTTAPVGLETVPLDLEFVGDFFNLADFFHDVKRFVTVANANVRVGGRLITVEGVRWSSDPELFPKLKAEIKATIYLSPKAEGTTAGATPAGPATDATTPASTPDASEATPAPVPTATATP
jgi:Tfp pilus assembly protein PilO